MKYKLKCRFCPTEVGEWEVDEKKFPAGVTNEALGIEDVRCDIHRAEHGTYQECEEIFEREIKNGSRALFKEMMAAAGHKKKPFVEAVKLKKQELEINA